MRIARGREGEDVRKMMRLPVLMVLLVKFVDSFTVENHHQSFSVYPLGHQKKRQRRLVSSSNYIYMKKTDGKEEEERQQKHQQQHEIMNHSKEKTSQKKRLILIRHGRTHMNEYLSKPGSKWGDENFTDVGLPDELYRDSPLCAKGITQAMELRHKISISSQEEGDKLKKSYCVKDIDLVVVSPLTRTFQTLEYGLLPHLKRRASDNNYHEKNGYTNKNDKDGYHSNEQVYDIPIVSLPLASERVYLKSDLGLPLGELKVKFPYAQFDKEFQYFEDEWWFTVKQAQGRKQEVKPIPSAEKNTNHRGKIHKFNSIQESQYKEWRPKSQNQTYENLGEPDLQFHQRMVALYEWLQRRDEECICMISHWGVLEWLTGIDFQNCEWREVDFDLVEEKVVSMKDSFHEDEKIL